MLRNLLCSSSFSFDERLDPSWVGEYHRGTEHEIYRVRLGSDYYGRKFMDAAIHVFDTLGVLLFALDQSNGVVTLNPNRETRIREGDFGFFIGA